MRYIGFLAMALAGLTVGMFLGIAVHGFTNPVATLVFALCGAALLLFIQLPLHISNQCSSHASRSRFKHIPQIPRFESKGSFSERLEKYKDNVAYTSSIPERESNMKFWIASESEYFEHTPPKPIGIIRRLLRRIQKVLSQQ